jgi:hypothetical protein
MLFRETVAVFLGTARNTQIQSLEEIQSCGMLQQAVLIITTAFEGLTDSWGVV